LAWPIVKSLPIGIVTTALLGGILFERFGCGCVRFLCTAQTLIVILLLNAQIQEPLGGSGSIRREALA